MKKLKEIIHSKNISGFTLVELLVVISIIGVVVAMSLFGLAGARESARDARRKSDLELIRASIETYRSDCSLYPLALTSPLVGTDAPPAICSTGNTYISTAPVDPLSPAQNYVYYSDGIIYEVCAHLEQGTSAPTVTCGGSSNCGATCNYKVTNP